MGVMEQRRRILMSAPHPVTTTPAPVASFNTDMVGKLKSAKFGFLPVQSGSGDPSPTNVRPISGWDGLTAYWKGKNLFGPNTSPSVGAFIGSNGAITSGTSGSAPWTISDYIAVKPGTTYYFQPNTTAGTSAKHAFYDANLVFISSNDSGPGLFVTPTDCRFMRFSYRNTSTNIQLELGSTATTYAPYTGSTIPVTFGAVNKNLFSGTLGEKWYHSFHAGDKYTISATCTGTGYGIARTYTNDETFVQSTSISVGAGDRWYSVLTISADADYMIISKSANTLSMTDIMVVQGDDTAHTDYVPYGTLYGGYVDVVRGEVVAEWAGVTLDGTQPDNSMLVNWRSFEGTSAWLYRRTLIPSIIGPETIDVLADKVKSNKYSPIFNGENGVSTGPSDWGIAIRLPVAGLSTASAINGYLAQNPIQVVYPLATPITYQLTPQEIKTLRGTNNVWSNANGEVSATYWTH